MVFDITSNHMLSPGIVLKKLFVNKRKEVRQSKLKLYSLKRYINLNFFDTHPKSATKRQQTALINYNFICSIYGRELYK